MGIKNIESPWNPAKSAAVTPKEYEDQVFSWLKASTASLDNFDVQPLKHLEGSGGDYEFDAVVECTLFHEAKIKILIECKRYSRPVEREKVLTLWAKLQAVNAHKAMMFATCGFQSGALKYAKKQGIATILFVNGDFTYETKTDILISKPPTWAELPRYAGILTYEEESRICCSKIASDRIEPLIQWVNS